MRLNRACGVMAAVFALLALSASCNAVIGNDPIVPWDGGASEGGVSPEAAAAVSCAAAGPGLTTCGPSATESCCTSPLVKGGSYDRTYDPAEADGGVLVGPDGAAVDLGDEATVASFRLDKYEVTVGRFRLFRAAWTGSSMWRPASGSGTHSYLNGGSGLTNSASAGQYEPGWNLADDGNVTLTSASLGCQSGATWTDSVGNNEDLPINCVNWWEAFAFCIWDGGFLPSESEWEYAAAGGSFQRAYPWGATDPEGAIDYAIYGCNYASCSAAPVGSALLGAGLWGQLDLAGNVWEWALDYEATYAPCDNCAYLPSSAPPANRVVRGGDFYLGASPYLYASYRGGEPPTHTGNDIGFRCARAP